MTHFDEVESFAAWDRRSSGNCDAIKDNLNLFERSHQQLIAAIPEEYARGKVLAARALNASFRWITEFHSYLDETYKSFASLSSFDEKKAWELTTQLGRRILIEVAVPRNGIASAVTVGHNAKSQLNKLVFWPILQSHDVMNLFLDANFEDHPTISAEYVKFLTANLGGDSDAKNNKELKEELATALKNLAKAQTSLSTAMNKIDELNKKFREFETRLTKAEITIKK